MENKQVAGDSKQDHISQQITSLLYGNIHKCQGMASFSEVIASMKLVNENLNYAFLNNIHWDKYGRFFVTIHMPKHNIIYAGGLIENDYQLSRQGVL